MPHPTRPLALFLLAAYAVLATLGVCWTVCHGDDGHVAIEAAASSCCDDTDGSDGTGDPPHPDEPPCGDCTDLPLLTDTILLLGTRSLPEPDAPHPARLPGLSGVADLSAFSPVGTPADPPPGRPPDPALDALRSVVLRC